MKTILVAAMTVCGRISPASMGSEEDRRLLERMRYETDASLIGAGTLRDGDPEMLGPDGVLFGDRIRAVVSGSGDFPWRRKQLFLRGPTPLIFTGRDAALKVRERLGHLAEVIVLTEGPQGLCLAPALEELGRRGARNVLLEGGGRLNYSCLAEGLVDEVMVTVCPFLAGDRYAASLVDGPQPLDEPFLNLEILSARQGDAGEMFLRYRVSKRSI